MLTHAGRLPTEWPGSFSVRGQCICWITNTWQVRSFAWPQLKALLSFSEGSREASTAPGLAWQRKWMNDCAGVGCMAAEASDTIENLSRLVAGVARNPWISYQSLAGEPQRVRDNRLTLGVP